MQEEQENQFQPPEVVEKVKEPTKDPFKSLRTHQEYQAFLKMGKKPRRGQFKVYDLPKQASNEEQDDYIKRCEAKYKEWGVKPHAVGPLKMPKPNKPCPCGSKYEDGPKKGQVKKFKRCCGRGL